MPRRALSTACHAEHAGIAENSNTNGNCPKLDQLLVDSMVGMCSMMMAMAIAYLAIAWFAARRSARWAVWALLIAGVAWVPYYFVIGADLARFGAHDAAKAP